MSKYKYNTSAQLQDIKVQGLSRVLANLQKEIERTKTRITAKGLVLVAQHIRYETETYYPLTPVDLGNLRASWFVTITDVAEVEDKLGYSGQFTNRPFKRMQYKASELKARHAAVKSASKAEVDRNRRTKPMMIMGYSAPYALYVHEHPSMQYKLEGAGRKWFQKAINRNIRTIVKILSENAKIK